MKKFVIPEPKLAQVPVSDIRGSQWTGHEINAILEKKQPPMVFNRIRTGATPDRIRQEASKAALLASGGKRVSVNLPGPAAADLAAINARDGTDNTLSIIAALKNFAGR